MLAELDITSRVELNNGLMMPRFGLGVYLSQPGDETYRAARDALAAGYRMIDTASFYQNEADVGRAIRDSGVPREQVFVTSKVWNDEQGYEPCRRSIEQSVQLLRTDWIDLFLVHWPIKRLFSATWQAMCEAYDKGVLRAIGVSNFASNHLEELDPSPVWPAVNQVECHPALQQWELQQFCQSRGTVLESWRPLMNGGVGDVALLRRLGEKHGKSPFQVAIRWQLQRGNVVIPKSVKKKRILSNADVFDFVLTDKEMAEIATLDQGQRLGKDPQEFSYLS